MVIGFVRVGKRGIVGDAVVAVVVLFMHGRRLDSSMTAFIRTLIIIIFCVVVIFLAIIYGDILVAIVIIPIIIVLLTKR